MHNTTVVAETVGGRKGGAYVMSHTHREVSYTRYMEKKSNNFFVRYTQRRMLWEV